MYELVRYFILPLQIAKFLRRGTSMPGGCTQHIVVFKGVSGEI
jgi:hypothetical protein